MAGKWVRDGLRAAGWARGGSETGKGGKKRLKDAERIK